MKKYEFKCTVSEELMEEIADQLGCDTVEEAVKYLAQTVKMLSRQQDLRDIDDFHISFNEITVPDTQE